MSFTSGDSCPFCFHSARCDNLRFHIRNKHPLDTLQPGWEQCETNQVIVQKNTHPKSGYKLGVCKICLKVLIPKAHNAKKSLFESHICRQPRSKNGDSATKPVKPTAINKELSEYCEEMYDNLRSSLARISANSEPKRLIKKSVLDCFDAAERDNADDDSKINYQEATTEAITNIVLAWLHQSELVSVKQETLSSPEKDELLATVQKLQSQLAASETKNQRLQNEIDSESPCLSISDDVIDRQEYEDRIHELRQESENSKKELEDLKQTLKNCTQELEDRTEELNQCFIQLKELAIENETLKQRI